MTTTRNERFVLATLLMIVLLAWVSPFRRDLLVGDETKYSRVIQQMEATRSFVVMRLDGEPWSHKPPLHFWAVWTLSKVFGRGSIWPFVLPSLLFWIALLLLVKASAGRFGVANGALAALIFASFWLSWLGAQTARMDMSFAFFITVGALMIHRSREGVDAGPLLIAGVCGGVAILIKGPMGGVILVGLYVVEEVRHRRRPRWRSLAALLALVAIPLVWLIPAIRIGGGAFGEALLVRQTIGRAFDSWAHGEPPWFYLVRFPLTFFPWFVFVALALVATIRSSQDVPEGHRFCASWFLVIFVSHSLISGKLDVYMIPALIPAAFLCAGWIERGGADHVRVARRGNEAVAAIVVGLALAIVAGAMFMTSPAVPELVEGWRPAIATTFFMIGMVAIFAFVGFRWMSSGVAALAAAIVALLPVFAIVGILTPLVNELGSTRPLVRALAQLDVESTRIGLYWTPHLWTRGMPSSLDDVSYLDVEHLPLKRPEVLVTRRDHAADLGSYLESYRRIDSVRMLGQDFDLFRERDPEAE